MSDDFGMRQETERGVTTHTLYHPNFDGPLDGNLRVGPSFVYPDYMDQFAGGMIQRAVKAGYEVGFIDGRKKRR